MMRRTTRPAPWRSAAARRGGVTLTEVLMSLLVVGVGLVSVAVMFPLSILRSIEATQLTSATVARYNAEEMIDAFPSLVFDPEGDGDANEHADTSYIVDPYGFDVLTTLSGAAVPANGASPVPFGSVLDRFPGAIATGAIIPDLTTPNPSAAASFVTLPDSWDTLLTEDDSIPITFDNTAPSIVLPGALEATGLTAAYTAGVNQPIYRAIFFDATGEVSHTRELTGIAADGTLTWFDPLPRFDSDGDGVLDADFTPATAWLQVQQRHYSWLLTVRRQTASIVDPGPPLQISDELAEIDVVIFFNRSPGNTGPMSDPPTGANPLAENVYPLLAPGFKLGVPSVSLDWGTNPEPFLKEGKFIFDPEGARWYRILKINEIGPTRVQLDLDRGAESDSVFSEDPAEQGLGVFMPGVIDVYPIKSKTARYQLAVP